MYLLNTLDLKQFLFIHLSCKLFDKKLKKSQRGLGAALTIDCNVGGDISSLICNKLKLDRERGTSDVNSEQIFAELKQILSGLIEPTIFLDDKGENFTVSIFDLGMDSGQTFSTFDEAVETYVNSIVCVWYKMPSILYCPSISIICLEY